MSEHTEKVLIAPDSFKGTMTADVVAEALARGVRRARVAAIKVPVSDGGEGLLDVVSARLRGSRHTVLVEGPLGEPVEAAFLLLPDGRAVIESAQACGLHLMEATPTNAEQATSRGVGQLMIAASNAGAQEILLGVGGTACSDGGAGALAVIADAGGSLAPIQVLSDVTTAYEESAGVFGPQKGADQVVVAILERRLHTTAERLARDPRGVPRSGAGGGLSGALWANFGAELHSGAARVLDLLGFDELAATSDLVLTGEGRLDQQTAKGKLIHEVSTRSARHKIPVVAVVGQDRTDEQTRGLLGLAGVRVARDRGELESTAFELVSGPRQAVVRTPD